MGLPLLQIKNREIFCVASLCVTLVLRTIYVHIIPHILFVYKSLNIYQLTTHHSSTYFLPTHYSPTHLLGFFRSVSFGNTAFFLAHCLLTDYSPTHHFQLGIFAETSSVYIRSKCLPLQFFRFHICGMHELNDKNLVFDLLCSEISITSDWLFHQDLFNDCACCITKLSLFMNVYYHYYTFITLIS